jgi:hypothetical protein
MQVKFEDISLAYEFVSGGGMDEHQAFLCRQTGKLYFRSELSEDLDELPDDVEDEEKYLQIPDQRELDLGKPLVLAFAREVLPNDYDEVARIFRKRGAYANFKALLIRRNVLDRWHDYRDKATERALRAWCEENSIEVTG